MSKIYEKTGKYDWIIGDDMKSALTQLRGQITRSTYTNLVDFLQFTGKPAIFKENVIAIILNKDIAGRNSPHNQGEVYWKVIGIKQTRSNYHFDAFKNDPIRWNEIYWSFCW